MENVWYAYNNVNFLTQQVNIHYSRDWQLYIESHDFFPEVEQYSSSPVLSTQ